MGSSARGIVLGAKHRGHKFGLGSGARSINTKVEEASPASRRGGDMGRQEIRAIPRGCHPAHSISLPPRTRTPSAPVHLHS